MWFLSFSRCPAAPHLSLLTGHYAVEILQTDVVVNLSQFKWRLASRTLWAYRTSCYPFEFLSHFFGLIFIPFFWGDNRISAVLYCILIINLAKLSDWGMFLFPCHSGYRNVVCCKYKHIDHFQPHNNFPAQSFHFRFGSVAPCPTLKSDVTASTPRTRYRRLAKPYLTGFSCCTQSAYKSKQSSLCSLEEIS